MSDSAIGSRSLANPPAGIALGEDWPTQTADTIERVVDAVRSKTAAPVERVARIVVYGLLAAVAGIAALVLAAIAVIRLLNVVVPGGVWAVYLILGLVFTAVGVFLWSKRAPKDDASR